MDDRLPRREIHARECGCAERACVDERICRLGIFVVALALYHSRFLPQGGEERATHTVREAAKTFGDVVVTFFQKRNIILLLFFIFLYRAGEGQVIKVGPLFLARRARRAGSG